MIIDPIGPAAAVDYRVRRGGSWLNDAQSAHERRRDRRHRSGPSDGFRLTVTLPCKTARAVVQ